MNYTDPVLTVFRPEIDGAMPELLEALQAAMMPQMQMPAAPPLPQVRKTPARAPIPRRNPLEPSPKKAPFPRAFSQNAKPGGMAGGVGG